MHLKILVLAFAVFVLSAPLAQAQTTIIEPMEAHFPYQRWVDEAKVPTPDVTIEVFEEEPGDGCPSRDLGYTACTNTAEGKIWIAATQLVGSDPRETFMHEIGHNFDTDVMPEWARARFDEIYGLGGPWEIIAEPEPMSPEEWFAEAYSQCAIKPYVASGEVWALGRGPINGSGPLLGMRLAHNKTCRMIQGL